MRDYNLPFYLRRWFINTLFAFVGTLAVTTITLGVQNYLVCKRLGKIAEKVNVANVEGLEEIRAYSPRLMLPETRARHSLLHSCLLFKSGEPIASDSIIAPAMKFYKNAGQDRERAHAHFYYGNILLNQQRGEEAYNEFLICSALVPKEDLYLTGQVSYFLGFIFRYNWNFALSEKYLRQSIESFEAIDHKTNAALAYGEYASLCAVTWRYKEAAEMAKKADDYYTSVGEMEKAWDFRIYYHFNWALHTDGYKEAVAEMEKVLDEWGWENANYDACRFYFRICTLAGETVKARRMLTTRLESEPIWNDTAHVIHQDSYMSRLNYMEGNYKEAYDLLSKAWDTSSINHYKQDKEHSLISNFFNHYTQEFIKINNRLSRVNNTSKILTICLLVTVVGSVVAIGLARGRRKKLVLSSRENERLRESLGNVFDSSKTNYESLNELVIALDSIRNRPEKAMELLRSYITQDNHFVRYIYEDVNTKYNNFFDELGERYPELTKTDLWICALTVEDYTPSAISLILNYTNSHSVHNRITNIRRVIGISGGLSTKTAIKEAISCYTESCAKTNLSAQTPPQGQNENH